MHSAGAGPHAVTGVAGWAEHAFALLTGIPAVRRVGLALVEGGGRRLRFTASDRDAGPELDWCDVDAYDDVPLNTALHTGTPVMGPLDSLEERYQGYVSRQEGSGTVALAAVPIVAAGQTLGGFLLLFDRPQPFDRTHRLELARLGRELGAALRRARSSDRRRPKGSPTSEPVPPGARVATHEVAGDPAAVSGARRFLRDTLRSWEIDDEDLVDNATLCLSELVTNALIHSHGGCLVRVILQDGVVTTTVVDWGASPRASVDPGADPLQVHGRGLRVVEALAVRWGHHEDSAGASVWFALNAV